MHTLHVNNTLWNAKSLIGGIQLCNQKFNIMVKLVSVHVIKLSLQQMIIWHKIYKENFESMANS